MSHTDKISKKNRRKIHDSHEFSMGLGVLLKSLVDTLTTVSSNHTAITQTLQSGL